MNDLIKATEKFVRDQFISINHSNLVYHNISHSVEVVDTVKEFIKEIKLTPQEQEELIIGAWFHDVGYLYTYDGHESKSIEICNTFLRKNSYPEEGIKRVTNLILATRMPQKPTNRIEEILCDADLSHAGKKGFYSRSLLLKEEWELSQNIKISEYDWLKKSINFLVSLNFFTPAAREKYTKQKIKNLEKLKSRLSEMDPVSKDIQPDGIDEIKKDKQVDRGIETMFRNTLRTHVEFSIMADNKANIMISVNTLILTAIAAVLSRKLDSNPHLIIPTATLTIVSLATLIFATLVTRPKITSGRFTADDIKQKKVNLLFFGNFFNMDLKTFEWGMNEMMKSKDYLYGSMIKDFYFLGQVLGQKYKYLRICYNLFMYGIIIAVLAFAVAISLTPTDLGPLIE